MSFEYWLGLVVGFFGGYAVCQLVWTIYETLELQRLRRENKTVYRWIRREPGDEEEKPKA